MDNIINNYTDGWKRIVDFDGKSSRSQFWTFFIVNWVLNILLGVILRNLAIVATIISVLLFIAELSIEIRRLHDTGKSGWNLLWYLLPIVGWIILLIYWLQPSK